MWLIVIVLLCAAAAAYVLFRKKNPDTQPRDKYVCDVCNQTECTCHKQEDNP